MLRGPSHVARVSSTMATQMPFMASATRGEGSYWDLRGTSSTCVFVWCWPEKGQRTEGSWWLIGQQSVFSLEPAGQRVSVCVGVLLCVCAVVCQGKDICMTPQTRWRWARWQSMVHKSASMDVTCAWM